MQYEDYVKAYERKSNDELLRLEESSKSLTPEATVALANELAKRRIDNAKRRSSFRAEEKRRKNELSRNPGNLFFHFHFGIGRLRFGKADSVSVPGSDIERFRTTIFIVILYFPLIPRGTYLVERRRGFISRKIKVLQRLPLDWNQVLRVWAVASLCVLVIIFTLTRLR